MAMFVSLPEGMSGNHLVVWNHPIETTIFTWLFGVPGTSFTTFWESLKIFEFDFLTPKNISENPKRYFDFQVLPQTVDCFTMNMDLP